MARIKVGAAALVQASNNFTTRAEAIADAAQKIKNSIERAKSNMRSNTLDNLFDRYNTIMVDFNRLDSEIRAYASHLSAEAAEYERVESAVAQSVENVEGF